MQFTYMEKKKGVAFFQKKKKKKKKFQYLYLLYDNRIFQPSAKIGWIVLWHSNFGLFWVEISLLSNNYMVLSKYI